MLLLTGHKVACREACMGASLPRNQSLLSGAHPWMREVIMICFTEHC